MNKKLNYVLFLLVTTVINIVIMGLLFIVPFVLFALLFKKYIDTVLPILYIVVPLFSIFGGFLIYSKLYKIFRQKVDMEKYFEPLFKKKW